MRTGNKTKRPFEVVATLLAAISSVVLLVGATGCGVHSSAAERPSPGLIVVAIDRSDSTDSLRAEQLNQLDLIATEAIADDIPLDVWVFDKSA